MSTSSRDIAEPEGGGLFFVAVPDRHGPAGHFDVERTDPIDTDANENNLRIVLRDAPAATLVLVNGITARIEVRPR